MFRLSPKAIGRTPGKETHSSKSCSPFGAPIILVTTKDGSLRMCVDYKSLNKHTIKNRYPIPCVNDVMDKLETARYFSSLDLQQGYHQTRLHLSNVPTMAFRIA